MTINLSTQLLGFAYKGEGSNTLYTASFNGQTWLGNTPISSEPGGIAPQSDLNPGVASFLNQLYLVYKGAGTTDLYMAYYSGASAKWYGNVAIKTMLGGITPASDAAPSLVVFNSLLYAVYKEAGSNDIYLSWFDGQTWYGNIAIKNMPGALTSQTNRGLYPAVYNGLLYLVYKDAGSNTFYAAWFDGTTWSGNIKISSQPGGISPESNYNPAVVVFNGKLYIVYKDQSSNKLYTAWFNGTTWSGNTTISSQPGGISPESNYTPGVLVFNGFLYLVYKGEGSNTLYSARFDGTTWSGNTTISSQPGGLSPESNYNPELALLPFAPGEQLSWLGQMPDSTLICDLNLPGTHDSAAINTGIYTPYARHFSSLTQQLDSGVRVLDIRLQVVPEGSTYSFMTCHGNIGLGMETNVYQSFVSALNECKQFLESNSSEFVVMSLKIDDWNNVAVGTTGVYTALQNVLVSYPVFQASTTMPALSQVRGKIYLVNRVNNDLSLGIPWTYTDNTPFQQVIIEGQNNWGFNAFVQDAWKWLAPTEPPAAAEKLSIFVQVQGKISSGDLLMNFASGVYGPESLLVLDIKGGWLGQLGQSAASQRPTLLGWSLFDYETTAYRTDTYGMVNVVQMIIASNSGYAGYGGTFKMI